jgi:glycosyltransferase involved in cell wall biosynthesis
MGKWSYQGVLVYPSGQDPFNEDVILDHYIDWKADMLITCKEPWCFQSSHRWAYNFCPHAIIDHSPVSPAITSRLHTAFRIIVVSRFAQKELAQAGFTENVRYVPHGCATDIFRPLENRAECKKLWFIKDPDDFTVLFVGKNQSRKMIPHVLKAYKLFRERNPDVKSHMLLWTDVNPISREQYEGAVALGVADVGVNLLPEIMNLGLGEVVLWPDAKLVREGLPDWAGPEGHDMVKLYNAADVVISLSGEGFWLPGLEAQSTGTPVICAEYGAAPEICGAGLTVPVEDYVILNTPGTRYPVCSLDKAAEALAKIMNADRGKLAKKARTFAQRYDWNVVMERYWKPFLEEAALELKPLVTSTGVKAWD